MSAAQRAYAAARMQRSTRVRSIETADLPAADAYELTNALYSAPGVRANDLTWYWQAGSPSQIQEWITLAADDVRIEMALDGDATGFATEPLDWRMYEGETRLLAWTACHEPLIELMRAVFQRDWVPEDIGDCDRAQRSTWVRSGFTVCRADGVSVVSGLASFDASWVSRLVARTGLTQPRPQPLLAGVDARLPLIVDEVEAEPDDFDCIEAGAIVRLDNRTLSSRSARILMPAGHIQLVLDVTGVQATVVGMASRTSGGDAMADDHPPADELSTEMQKCAGRSDHRIPIGAVPVRLTFTAGRVTLPYGALSDVGPGYVFALDKRLDDQAILLHANDVPIATGELVTIGDLIGVRITRMLPPA